MSVITKFIDVDIALGVEVDEDTKGRDQRVIYRIDLGHAKVRDKLAAIKAFQEASREDRSTMARLYGYELPQGGE